VLYPLSYEGVAPSSVAWRLASFRSTGAPEEPGTEGSHHRYACPMASKDKGGAKTSKKAPQKSLKEKRAAKKQKNASK
jgi:hypothetical protein